MNQTLLVLHGALGSKEQLIPLIDELSKAFEVKTMSFSGHGGKPLDGNFSIDKFTDEVSRFIMTEKLAPVDIFGYSMGGYVALNLAHKEPEKVNRIFTLGTKLEWTPEIAAKEVKMLDADKIEAKVPAFARTLQKRHKPNDWKAVLSKTAEMMLSLGKKDALPFEEFKNIEHEVKIGIGTEDNMVTLQESQRVAELLPHGQLVEFDGFKHPIEQVDLTRLSLALKTFFYD